MGRGRHGKEQRGRGEEGGRGGGYFTDEYDEMPGWTYRVPGWNEATEFSDC